MGTIVKQNKVLFDSILFSDQFSIIPTTEVEQHKQHVIDSQESSFSSFDNKTCNHNSRTYAKKEQNKNNINKSFLKRIPAESNEVKCILSIEQNGDFTLTPKINEISSMMPPMWATLRGQWNIESTCYCVTDRHYDDLTLQSYPRARIWRRKDKLKKKQISKMSSNKTFVNTNPNNNNNETTTTSDSQNNEYPMQVPPPLVPIVERAYVEFRCKVWGRYGSQVVRRLLGYKQNRGQSRMTHGTILAVRTGSNKFIVPSSPWLWWKRRIILGTFSAKALPNVWEIEEEKKKHRNNSGSIPGVWVYRYGRWVFKE